MNTVQDEWKNVKHILVPENAPPVQAEQSRLCFYAGAEACLRIFVRIGDMAEQGTISEDAAGLMMEAIHQETRHYSREYAAKRGLPQTLIDLLVPGESKPQQQ